MNGKLAVIPLLVIMAAALFCIGVFSDDSEATSFGSSDIGAKTITFDSNGGSGGYTIHAFSGNTVYFPTEYKAPGTSNSEYVQISKSNCYLLGWSTNSSASSPTYLPGQAWQVQDNITFYAVWKSYEPQTYQSTALAGDVLRYTRDHYVQALNQSISFNYRGGYAADLIGLIEDEQTSNSRYEIEISISINGEPPNTDTHYSRRTVTVTSGGITAAIDDGNFTITGSPSSMGVYEIHLKVHLTSANAGESGHYECFWYVSTYNERYDPSNIHHITHSQYDNSSKHNFQNNSGPYGTAIILPGACYSAQDGWNAERENQPAFVPLGGTYVITGDRNITPYSIPYSQVLSKIALVAYNANGGDYTGHIAHVAERGAYCQLSSNIVTRPGYTFLGWNTSGSISEPIHPAGSLYYIDLNEDNQGEYYIEFKAVWSSIPTDSMIECYGLPGDERSFTFNALSGRQYYLPSGGFDVSGYMFKGWSDIANEIGSGDVTVTNPITAQAGTHRYYPVYEKIVYTCTVEYNANGGEGSMPDKVVTSPTLPVVIQLDPVRYVRTGYTFLGWSDHPNASSPNAPDNTWTFTKGERIVLYAVWSESPSTDSGNLFIVVFSGNGTNVSNIVTPTYSKTTTAREITVPIPSWEPVRQGYDFRGWSLTSNGEPQYRSGESNLQKSFTIKLTGTDTYRLVTLYAIWESVGNTTPGMGEKVNVTFMVDSVPVHTEKIYKGGQVPYYSPASIEGSAFDRWLHDTVPWDFSDPVEEDMVLNARYVKVFSLIVSENTVTVILDKDLETFAWAKIGFSDGFTETYYTKSIPSRTVTADGSVTVTVETEDGTYTAQCGYSLSDSQNDDKDNGDGEEKENKKDSGLFDRDTLYIIGGVLGIIAIIVLAGRFLI